MSESNLPATQKTWTAEDVQLIKDTVAQGATDSEFKLLLYTANKYQLDPLVKQIWCVKYDKSKPASIYTGRDGFLSIAHRSGQFDGMESGTKMVESRLFGWAKVWRKDMTRPFSVEVDEREYKSTNPLWRDKPRTMIQKVAESQALRRAFDISGLYSPDEVPEAQVVTAPVEPAGKGNGGTEGVEPADDTPLDEERARRLAEKWQPVVGYSVDVLTKSLTKELTYGEGKRLHQLAKDGNLSMDEWFKVTGIEPQPEA